MEICVISDRLPAVVRDWDQRQALALAVADAVDISQFCLLAAGWPGKRPAGERPLSCRRSHTGQSRGAAPVSNCGMTT